MASYEDSTFKGKWFELRVISELMRLKLHVYTPLVDDQGIDCIIRSEDGKKHIEIQIKARSEDAKRWYFFPLLKNELRENLYIILFTEKTNHFWVIPSMELLQLGSQHKTGKNKDRIRISIPRTDAGDKADKFEGFKDANGFNLLLKALNG
jgi:hypothetical protein